jgi:hypothetical protein
MRVPAFAAALLALSALDATAQICTPFTDVAADDPFCTNIQWMFNRGITLGCTTTAYCPAGLVRRDQMAAFMNRFGNITFQQGGNAFGTTAVLGTTDNQSMQVRVANARVMAYQPHPNSPNVIGGHASNAGTDNAQGATIAGGGHSFEPNVVRGGFTTVGGGAGNVAGDGINSFATVAGGNGNMASNDYSTVGGGFQNVVTGRGGVVPGGFLNEATAAQTFAAGTRAKATTVGSFIWADARNFDFAPSVANFFGVRATGGVGLTVAVDSGTGAVTQFCNLLPGVAAWQCTSDRDAKENFAPVDTRLVLDRLAAMPMTTWNFRGADPAIRNLGPTAQDFNAAFGLGIDDKSIASGNLHGVALAAIQGLNAKLEATIADQAREIAAQREAIDELRRAVAALRPATR